MILKVIIIAIVVLVLLKIISLPIRLLWKLLINTACGLVMLVLVNLLAPLTGVTFDLNFVTAATAGFLGLPGILLLFVVHFLTTS